MISQKNKQGWRNPWTFGLIAVIFSGVLINAQFLWNVLHHPTRLLDDNYSVKAHNQYDAKWVQQQAERSTLGWKAKLHSPQQLQNDPLADPATAKFVVLASPAELKFDLADRDGKAVVGAKVKINAQWPGNPQFDFSQELHESSAGQYAGELKFSRAGNWDLLIEVDHESSQFSMEQKVFVEISKQ